MSDKNESELLFDSSDDEQEILQKAVKLVNSSYSYFKENIDTYLNDCRFIFIDQWSASMRGARSIKRKQILTANRLFSYCQEIIGEASKLDPAPKVRPDNNVIGTSSEHAKLLQGILRKEFYENRMSQHKLDAFKSGVYGGFGVLWVDYDYETPYSFHKKFILRALEEPTAAFFDPMSRQATKSDAEYCGYFSTVSKDEFYKLYPDAKSSLSFKSTGYLGEYKNVWGDTKTVRIANFWQKERYKEKIALLSTGESMVLHEAEELIKEQEQLIRKMKKLEQEGANFNPMLAQKIEIIETRESTDCYKIVYYKMIADEILEFSEWPSKFLPGVFVDHDSINYKGRQYTKSFHRDAQDMQRYLNYLISQSADALMDLHHGTWLANPEQMSGDVLDMWLSPQNDKGILIANKDSDGQMPQYVPPPQISPAFDSQYSRTVSDIESILGRFDAGRGKQDNAVSGVAINSRAIFGNLGAIVPLQNLEYAVEQVARIVIDMIPAVYDTQRVITIGGKGEERKVRLNHSTPTGMQNDMSQKGYDVTLEGSVSFTAQRMSGNEQMRNMIQTNPALSPVLSDLIAENLDLPNAAQIVERIRKAMMGIPTPQIISEATGMQLPPPPQTPNPQAVLAQKQFELEQARIENERAKISNDSIKNTIESQKLQNDAITEHASTMADIRNNRTDIITHQISAEAEIRKEALQVAAEQLKMQKELDKN